MDDPAWIDYPKRPLITLRGYMAQPDDASPEMVQADLAAKREAAIAAARGKLASAPAEDRTRFETLLHAAQIANVLHEDHNYLIDQMLQNRSRHAFIEAGKRLAAQGRIAAAEDVLYLSIFELQSGIRSGSAGGLHDLVDERRRRHEYQRTIVPPRTLGTPPAQVEPQTNYQKTRARFYGAAIEPSVEVHQIRGNAGSRGKVTGMARVALSLEQAANLQHGEILVCTTTAPAWTPLFATAAAVVTDTGGILSHCAAVAREFGIPAVVGTNVATSRIKSGQRVTVDGSRGIVTIEVV